MSMQNASRAILKPNPLSSADISAYLTFLFPLNGGHVLFSSVKFIVVPLVHTNKQDDAL